MAKKKSINKQTEVHLEFDSPGALKKTTGTVNGNLGSTLIKQTSQTLWVHSTATKEEAERVVHAAMAALKGISPRNEIEGMLATQMVATHNAALECLRRAMLPDQTFAGRDTNLKHAAKLLMIYAKQIETLNKNRGKGQQKVTVEYVNVEGGGQAIVGNIEASPGKTTLKKKKTLKTISKSQDQSLNLDPLFKRETSKVRNDPQK